MLVLTIVEMIIVLVIIGIKMALEGNWLYQQFWFREFCFYSLKYNIFPRIGTKSFQAEYIAVLIGGTLGARPLKSKDMPKGFKEVSLESDIDLKAEENGEEILHKIDKMLRDSIHDMAEQDTAYLKAKEAEKPRQ